MATPEQTLCEVCGERRATHYICYGGTGKSSNLCDECFTATAPQDMLQSAEAAREAHCQYCGGQPCAGGTDFLAQALGIQQSRYMCMSCTQEFHRFTQQELQQGLQQGSHHLSQQEQVAAIARLSEKADRHMMEWVSKRDSR